MAQRSGRARARPQAGTGHPVVGATPETEALARAADHCRAAFAYCANSARFDDLPAMQCLVDCAELCNLTAAFIARDAAYAHLLRDLCAQQANDAAGSCERHPRDEVLAACARALREAVEALTTQAVAEP